MATVGDLRAVEYDPGVFEIELFAKHQTTIWAFDPFWALPNWMDLGISEFVGPFSTLKEANAQIRIFKNNNDSRLQGYLKD